MFRLETKNSIPLSVPMSSLLSRSLLLSVSACFFVTLLWMRRGVCGVPSRFSWNASTVMDPLRRECHLGIIVGRVRQFTNKFLGVACVGDRAFWNCRLTNDSTL